MKFLYQIQQDFKLFLSVNVLIMAYRWAFIWIYSSQLNTAGSADLWGAFWYGLRISLKTSAALTAVALLFATLPALLSSRWPADRIRRIWGGLCIGGLTFLFVARIPYYKIFNQTYNLMLFNGMKDDKTAILQTAVQEYQLWPRLLAVAVITALLVWLWLHISRLPVWQPARHRKVLIGVIVVVLPVFAVFCRFGGAFNSDDGVHWESAARTRSPLLNEAILDDGQALYRAYKTHQRSNETAQRQISPEELKAAVQTLGGNTAAPTVDEAFARTAPGSPLPQAPKQVVLILGENYALWPLLPAYQDMGLCRTGERLARDGAYTYHFLPNGNGTMTSLNGFFTGLAEVDMYPNYHHTPKEVPYGTGIGETMKKMGYKTVFWYGGLSSWQDIRSFAEREGFDEFHCADEIPAEDESGSWGISDGVLLEAVSKYMAQDTGKTFHFILTTSNHPPFAYNVDAKGFPRQEVAAKLPESIPRDKETMDQLGHIWYADDVIGKFVDQAEQQQPGTLFVVTGDHAERFNFATTVSLQELSGIPCFFYGGGVTKAMLPATMTGSHMQLIPTLASLLMPAGSTYYSLLPPLQQSDRAFNHRLVIDQGTMAEEKKMNDEGFEKFIEAARLVSIWRITKGNDMP